MRSWIRKWPTTIVHTGVHEVLLWHTSLRRVLEATILLRARIELVEVLWLLLLILELTVEILWILRPIEASVLLLHSHVIQALPWRSYLLLIAS